MKYNIKVCLQPVKNSALLPVRLRVTWCGCRCDLSAGVSYNIEKWLPELGRAKQNTTNNLKQSAREVNAKIEDCVRWVDSFFVKSELSATPVTAKTLKAEFASVFGRRSVAPKGETIGAAFDRFMLQNSTVRGWSWNTRRKYGIIKTIIKEYRLTLADLGVSFLQNYINAEIVKGRKNTTIAKNIRCLKVFGDWCFNAGLISSGMADFVPHLKWSEGNNKAVVFLEFAEIETLLKARDSLSASLQITADMFLFSCFSGLRFSDIVQLKKTDIYNGKINIVTQKTAEALQIELNNYTVAIYEKYKNFFVASPLLFPSISNQVLNRELKTIFAKLDLRRPVTLTAFSGSERIETTAPLCDIISFHAARRTFVVECLRRGIAPAVVMKWTGHADFDAMRPYIEIVDSLKESEMQKFNI
jgi:integrase